MHAVLGAQVAALQPHDVLKGLLALDFLHLLPVRREAVNAQAREGDILVLHHPAIVARVSFVLLLQCEQVLLAIFGERGVEPDIPSPRNLDLDQVLPALGLHLRVVRALEHAHDQVALTWLHVQAEALPRCNTLLEKELVKPHVLIGHLLEVELSHLAIERELHHVLPQAIVHLSVALVLRHLRAELHNVPGTEVFCVGAVVDVTQALHLLVAQRVLTGLGPDLVALRDKAADGGALVAKALDRRHGGLEGAEPDCFLAAMLLQLRVQAELVVLEPLVRADERPASRGHLRVVLLPGEALPDPARAIRDVLAEEIHGTPADPPRLGVQHHVGRDELLLQELRGRASG
mmetsp:Transcript_129279/g.402093  ORF Transcript_129279/g.402093 Transcript_129279/m.402093 type:complete len:347 (+) Transcript_129279:1110-2150(+)